MIDRFIAFNDDRMLNNLINGKSPTENYIKRLNKQHEIINEYQQQQQFKIDEKKLNEAIIKKAEEALTKEIQKIFK